MKEEHTYYLEWNEIDGDNGLLSPGENIVGTSPMDALKKRFSMSFKMVGKEERNPDIILTKAKYDKEHNTLKYWGNGATYCYMRSE